MDDHILIQAIAILERRLAVLEHKKGCYQLAIDILREEAGLPTYEDSNRTKLAASGSLIANRGAPLAS